MRCEKCKSDASYFVTIDGGYACLCKTHRFAVVIPSGLPQMVVHSDDVKKVLCDKEGGITFPEGTRVAIGKTA